MNAARHVREASTLRAAEYQYARSHDWWSEQEQLYLRHNRPIEAAGAHEYANRCLRAYIAEQDDPEPKGLRE